VILGDKMKRFPSTNLGYVGMADTTCAVYCDCDPSLWDKGEDLWVSDSGIVRCPYCGKGYKTEFIVWQYEADEIDEEVK
jgi:hypothetical protein